MQNQQQKNLQNLIQITLNDNPHNMAQHANEIVKLISHRVDMPKHLILFLSKKLAIKEQDKLSLIFDILWFVTQKYQNKIALFNQISGNKQFLFKITSILSIKDLKQNLKVKIIDIVYQWKQLFKDNKELFPNFWTFYQSFQKKGFTPSNLNFQTRYLQQNQPSQLRNAPGNQPNKQGSDKNIFDLLQGESDILDFNKIQKSVLIVLYNELQKLQLQNKIISNTSPQILDVPPIIKQNMADLKIMQQKINKFISEHKNKVTIQTTTCMIKAIHLTQKRYTQLITKYLPQKFELSEHLKKFQQFCKSNQSILKQPEVNILKGQIDLLDINVNKQEKVGQDLLDLQVPNTGAKNQQKGIKNFFGNLLDRVNSPSPQQVSLSNKPIEDDFKTDMDFTHYKDPKTIQQHYDYVRNLTAQDLFKF